MYIALVSPSFITRLTCAMGIRWDVSNTSKNLWKQREATNELTLRSVLLYLPQAYIDLTIRMAGDGCSRRSACREYSYSVMLVHVATEPLEYSPVKPGTISSGKTDLLRRRQVATISSNTAIL